MRDNLAHDWSWIRIRDVAANTMTKVDSDRFVELIRLSRTVDEPVLDKALAEADEDTKLSSDALARHFIGRGMLTQWQADNLLNGKHKGFRLGNYRLKRKLGRGGMSTVYLAEHALMKREAAIKVLPRKRVEDSSYLARFHREAQAAAALDHPNIVRIYDVAADGNTHFIAMEFIDGQDLQTRVAADGRLDCDLAADYIAQSAVGLQHAHDIGLIHRDIKPANLLANEKGIIKILDMGLAKFDEDEDATSLTVDHNENVLGTVDYLSPEQAVDSHNVDHRADLYSLGCTLYFLLVGNAPFPDGSLAQRLLKHQKSKPAPLLDKRGDIPPELVLICNKMMAKDPEKRSQSAMEIAEELTEYLAARGKAVTGSSDSSAGSRIGLAAAVVRELADAQEDSGEDLNDVDTLIATMTDDESDKDTTISRTQDETRKSHPGKSTPALMPKVPAHASVPPEDDLQLVSNTEEATAEVTTNPTNENGAQEGADTRAQLDDLEKELTPIRNAHDPLSAKLDGGTRLQSRGAPEPLVPMWVWIVGGVVLTLVVLLVVILSF